MRLVCRGLHNQAISTSKSVDEQKRFLRAGLLPVNTTTKYLKTGRPNLPFLTRTRFVKISPAVHLACATTPAGVRRQRVCLQDSLSTRSESM